MQRSLRVRRTRVALAALFLVSFAELPQSASAASQVLISGLAGKYGPNENVSYKITGTPGDTCQLSYQNQTPKSFTFGASGSVTASFTTGTTASLLVINVTCAKSGSAKVQSELVLQNIPLAPTPQPSKTSTTSLPGTDASINSTLTSIIEPLANTCEEGEVFTVRADALAFAQGDNVKVNLFNANNSELTLSMVSKSASAGEKSLNIKTRVCQSDPAYLGSAQDYRLVMTYSDAPGLFVQTQEYKFRLISRVEVANFSQYAVSRVRANCIFDQFVAQNSYVQSGTTRKSGDKMTIKGTLYRAGLVAPNDTLNLVRVIDPGNSKIIATTKTDKDGKYSFTFSATTYPKALLYHIEAPERKEDLGPVPGPFPKKIWAVFIDCNKECKISETSMRETAPVNSFTQVCLENLSFYKQVVTQGDNENSKLLRNVIVYPILSNIVRSRSETNARAAADAATSANSSANSGSSAGATSAVPKSPPSASGSKSSSSGGGRCYVNGYTTKKGKRVSGYYRSC
ncbi:MAG: hypothetical protein NTY85_03395 [Actinobacteria bacterium]|nr:hypothetical protein [Actinomycetota bacterium]